MVDEFWKSENWCHCEISIVLNDTSQGTVETRLSRGGIFNAFFTTNLLLSLPWKDFF